MEEKIETRIYKSRDKQEIQVPKIPFEKFYTQDQFTTIADVKKTKEWKNIFCHYYDFSSLEEDISIHETKDEIENYNTEEQKREMVRCANSFAYFCMKYIKISHPIFGLIPFIPYTYQKRVIECYGKNRFNILSKFRQGGLTTVSVLWGLWRCLFKPDQRIMVVSKTDREAIAAGEIVKTAIEYLPHWLKPETDKFNEHEKQFKTTNSVLWFYTVEAARGKAITILIIDEAAFIKDMTKHWKSLYPVISTGGCCQVISTVNGVGNWYEETYHLAEDGKNAFNVIELDYWEHPLYNDPKWIEDTRSNLGEKGWAQEVERSFESSGDTWIKAAIRSILTEFTKNNLPLRFSFPQWQNEAAKRKFEWDEGALWVWKEPMPGHEYILAADTAEGHGENADNSAFSILDVNTLEQVAEFYSNTVHTEIFAQIISWAGYYYNTALVVVENCHPGPAVLSVLQYQIAYENLYYENNKQQSPGLKSTKASRPQFLTILQQRLLNGTVKINSIRVANELDTFINNAASKKPEAQRGKHDDAIFALAIALHIREMQNRNLPVGSEVSDETLQMYKSEIYKEIKNEIFNDSLEDFFMEEDDGKTNMKEWWEESSSPKYRRKNDKLLREMGW